METLYMVLIAVSVLVLGFVVAVYLRKRKVFDQPTNVDFANQLMLLSKLIVLKTVENEKQKEKLNEIFEAIQDVFNFVYVMSTDLTIEEKKVLTQTQIEQRLRNFQIEVNEEDELLITLIIDTFVSLLPKK